MIKKKKIQLGNYIVVNYHYVRNPSNKFSGINSCPIKEFERQISFLSRTYKIVSVPEVFNSAKNSTSGKFCAITFDDCLKDVYTNAFPILKKYNSTATIFPIASVLEGKLPYVHKIHVLISVFGADRLVELFNDFLKDFPNYRKKYKIHQNKRLYGKIRLDDDIPTANFKETIAIIPDNLRDSFIVTVFKKAGLKEQDLLRDMFMDKDEIRKLANDCMEIGSHSYRHCNLTRISLRELKKDISLSASILSKLFGRSKKINIFSYPYGRWNDKILKILPDYGFEYAVTIEEKPLNKKPRPLIIPRYDTNNIRNYLNSLN